MSNYKNSLDIIEATIDEVEADVKRVGTNKKIFGAIGILSTIVAASLAPLAPLAPLAAIPTAVAGIAGMYYYKYFALNFIYGVNLATDCKVRDHLKACEEAGIPWEDVADTTPEEKSVDI